MSSHKVNMNLYVFGDQTADQIVLLRKIAARRDNSLLATFLERASAALRAEVQRLPKTQRSAVPDFLSISQLILAYVDLGKRIPEIESAFVTIAQLGHYIGCVA
jgi:hypothetical protein